jgi:hypothetical protein
LDIIKALDAGDQYAHALEAGAVLNKRDLARA